MSPPSGATLPEAAAKLAEQRSVAYRKRLDAGLLRWELDHFRQWALEALGVSIRPGLRAALDHHFDALAQALSGLGQGFVHRDFQSRNLMWASPDRLVVIDFQDAFIGPIAYDLVALLCDSYVPISSELQAQMLARYVERRGWPVERRDELTRDFRLITVQRKLKDAGRFVFFDRVRGTPEFLRFFAPSLRYVDRALAALPEYAELREVLAELLPGFPDVPVPPAASAVK